MDRMPSFQVVGLIMIILSFVKYNITSHAEGLLSIFGLASSACNVNAYEALGPLATYTCSTVNLILLPPAILFLLGMFFLMLPVGKSVMIGKVCR